MANKLYNEESIRAIASAIREKNGTENTYSVSEMSAAIRDLTVGNSIANKMYRDIHVIPDKYNTGCKGELQSITDYFGASYAEQTTFGINPTLQTAFGTAYENIHFDMPVSMNKQGLQPITFKNCKFSGESTYNVMLGGNFEASGIEVVFENCEFTNAISAAIQPGSRIKLINCKIHDMAGDGGKVFDYGSYENCYFYNIGYAEGVHADGIQVTSVNHDFKIINCRFDMPYYDKFVPNAAIFFCIEEDSYGSVIKDCVMTGGNHTFGYGRKYLDVETPAVLENNTVENIIVGCSYQYSKMNDNSNSFDYSEVKDADKLFVSSVYQENGNIKLLVTNYTGYDKTLIMVTDTETKQVVIPKCPTYAEGLTKTSFADFPFDIEVEVKGSYVICYDSTVSADNQIRFMEFEDSRIVPSGTIEITSNGTYDVTTYASALVNISSSASDSGLPDNIKMGTFTVDTHVSDYITINHNLGVVPTTLVVVIDEIRSIAEANTRCTVASIRVGTSMRHFISNGTTLIYTANGGISDVTETTFNFNAAAAAYPIRSDVTYRWFAWT